MLTSLSIKNFALIEDAEIHFQPGLNVITGETGAGKSILLGALSMILGERASTEHIRSGSDKAIIEGVFLSKISPALKQIFSNNDIEQPEDALILRRELSLKGTSRCFINDHLITNAVLKLIGDQMVDLHGQHEHQSLLREEIHRDIVDAFGHHESIRSSVKVAFDAVSKLQAEINRFRKERDSLAEIRDLIAHQLKEISDISPRAGEDEQLLQDERILGNSEKLFELTKVIRNQLYEAESSVSGSLNDVSKRLQELQGIDDRFKEIQAQFDSAKIILDEISRWVGDYHHKIVFEPERLEEIRERLMAIQRLRKKYGSIEKILEKQQSLQAQLNLTDNFDSEIKKLEQDLEHKINTYRSLANDLSVKRESTAALLDKKVIHELKKLGIDDGKFVTSIQKETLDKSWLEIGGCTVKADDHGYDQIEFLLSANVGEPPKPLVKVASGGEVSRIMLSLKTALAETDQIPSMVFDEIDVGISGRIAQAVGRALLELAGSHQVICITHLAQIAGLSQAHFSVRKSASKGKTTTVIQNLSPSEKVEEVAKLLGGETITEASLRNARELIGAGID